MDSSSVPGTPSLDSNYCSQQDSNAIIATDDDEVVENSSSKVTPVKMVERVVKVSF